MTDDRFQLCVELLESHGLEKARARRALEEAKRHGCDVDQIVNAWCARHRYRTQGVLSDFNSVALIEFDLILATLP
jgi:hypothetical protein